MPDGHQAGAGRPEPALTPALIDEAAARIAGRVRLTPVLDWSLPVPDGEVEVTLKLELFQHVGSFKPRGAFKPDPRRPHGPKSGSGGVRGQPWLGRGLCRPSTRDLGPAVYVPKTAPPVKIAGIRRLGAETVLVGSSYADAADAAYRRASAAGALYVHAYDDIEVVAGQGTVGRELDGQVPDVTSVLVVTGEAWSAASRHGTGKKLR